MAASAGPASDPAQFDRDAEMDLLRRAFAAWFHAGHHETPAASSSVEGHDGKLYVRLTAADGTTLAVYRVLNSGLLKSLKRPPRPVAPDWYADDTDD